MFGGLLHDSPCKRYEDANYEMRKTNSTLVGMVSGFHDLLFRGLHQMGNAAFNI